MVWNQLVIMGVGFYAPISFWKRGHHPENDRYRNVLYQLSIAVCGYLSKKRSLNSGKSTPNVSDIVRKPFWMIYHCNQQLSSTLEIQISQKCLKWHGASKCLENSMLGNPKFKNILKFHNKNSRAKRVQNMVGIDAAILSGQASTHFWKPKNVRFPGKCVST